MVLEEDWAKGSEGAELLVMRCLQPTSWVAGERAEGHVLRYHPTSQYSEGLKLQH